MSEQETRQGPVSLVNFQRNAPKVVFTERASLEAIKRCAFKMEDFGYRSLKDFKKPGVDQDVAKMLFTKNEERRQKMIAEALLAHFPSTSKNSLAVSVESYRSIDAWQADMAMTEASFERLQDIIESAGELERRAEFSALVDNTYVKEVYAAL